MDEFIQSLYDLANIAYGPEDAMFPNLWEGLVGLWSPSLGPTGLTLYDWSGNQNHGALTNMEAATDWVVGERGWTLDYDGGDDYVNLGSALILDFGSGDDFSISLWFKMPTIVSGIQMLLMRRQSNTRYGITTNTSERINFEISDGITARVVSSSPIQDGVWHHVAGVRTAGVGIELFIDGKSVDTDLDVANISVPGASVIIGSQIGSSRWFDGQIGDVSIYNSALTQNEIAAMSAGASPLVLTRRAVGIVAVVVVDSAIYSATEIKTTYRAREIESSYNATEKKTSYRARTDEERN